MPGRNTNAGEYRYGFNGQEKDDEIAGSGNSYTAEYWQYDPRLGRRWNLDPVVKFHESPYAVFANNPIWFTDPNGADSALASGSNTWQWHTEKGDTYYEISKRTGVTVDNLRKWNGYKDKAIPTHTMLNLSDPNAQPATTQTETSIPGILNSDGTINVLAYREASNVNLGISVKFTPCSVNKDNTYTWFQTFATTDPTNGEPYIGDMAYGNDIDAGTRAALGGARFADGSTVMAKQKKQNAWLDGPGGCGKAHVNYKWAGYLTLLKKVDDKYVIISTFKYNFEVLDDKIVPGVLRFNPEVDPNSTEYKHHVQKLNQWQSRSRSR